MQLRNLLTVNVVELGEEAPMIHETAPLDFTAQHSTSVPKPSSTTSFNVPQPTSTSPQPSVTSSPKAAPTGSGGKMKYAGVNIAGFDFSCSTDGSCQVGGIYAPLPATGGPDGSGQMKHFVQDDNLNAFRLPVSWQYLVDGNLGGSLSANNLGNYDKLLQACLGTGALCIIDIHNYARWNGGVIGQGGPSNDQFVSLWTQLATKYASPTNVAFGIMNEPHDINIQTWAETLQLVVTAIRKAGATSQYILLPGNNYSSASEFAGNSAAALLPIHNPDGSNTNLIFDIHQYLDSDFSGTNAECSTNKVDAFTALATFLRSHSRQAFLSETGGGNTQSCVRDLCQLLQYCDANADVFLGYTGWAAGSFDRGYVLSETPAFANGQWTDQLLVSSCIKR
ncbi:MAG: Endoglucanase EG-II [Trizodia sp. TS-e1964]|nr:MAG: Endoglucanase EG-II [Trizodia sp. TS-e1964]